MRQEALESALLTAEKLSQIPNAPFLYRPSLNFIKQHESLRSKGIKTAEDTFAFYVNISRGNPARKIIVTSHLDHPLIILDGKGNGIPFGSISPNLLNKSPVKIYSRDGDFIGEGVIRNPQKRGNKTFVNVDGPPHPVNSQAIWDIEPYLRRQTEIVEMMSADDILTTSVALEAIQHIAKNPAPNVDITFTFTKVEEIRQLSATGIATFRKFPFGEISERDVIIPLEADHIETTQRHFREAEKLGLPTLSSNKGLMVKTSNHNVVLGQEFPEDRNQAEDILLNLAKKHNLTLQTCVAAGTDDGTAFTIFPTTPHIVTLSLPNPTKHNFDGTAVPVYERVRLADVRTLLEVLVSLGTESLNHEPNPRSISSKLKSSSLNADKLTVSQLRREHIQVLLSSYPHLISARYFAESFADSSFNVLAAVLARILPPVINLLLYRGL